MRYYTKFWPELVLFTILMSLLFFDLGGAEVERWDEYTNIQVVKGNISPFFEKPPLWYFVTQLFYQIFGDHVVIYRLVSALSGLAFGLTGYFYCKSFFNRKVGILFLAGLLTTGQLFFKSTRFFSTHTFRSADLDGLQLVLIFISFFSLGLFFYRGEKLRWVIAAALFTGLAFLTKGPFAFLPLIVFIAYLVVSKRLRLNYKHILVYIIVVLLTVLPWHIFMITKYGEEFIREYAKYHIVQRTLEPLEGHEHSPVYYIKIWADPRMFAGFWLLLISLPVLTLRLNWWKEWKHFQLLFGFFFTVCLLLVIQTRLAWYLLYLHLFSLIIIAEYLATAVPLFMSSKKYITIFK